MCSTEMCSGNENVMQLLLAQTDAINILTRQVEVLMSTLGVSSTPSVPLAAPMPGTSHTRDLNSPKIPVVRGSKTTNPPVGKKPIAGKKSPATPTTNTRVLRASKIKTTAAIAATAATDAASAITGSSAATTTATATVSLATAATTATAITAANAATVANATTLESPAVIASATASTSPADTVVPLTFADIVISSATDPSQNDSGSWRTVSHKRQQGIRGKKSEVETKQFHCYPFHSDTSEEDMSNFITSLVSSASASFTVHKIRSKGEYASFKIGIPTNCVGEVLKTSHWPRHSFVKEWENRMRTPRLPTVGNN